MTKAIANTLMPSKFIILFCHFSFLYMAYSENVKISLNKFQASIVQIQIEKEKKRTRDYSIGDSMDDTTKRKNILLLRMLLILLEILNFVFISLTTFYHKSNMFLMLLHIIGASRVCIYTFNLSLDYGGLVNGLIFFGIFPFIVELFNILKVKVFSKRHR